MSTKRAIPAGDEAPADEPTPRQRTIEPGEWWVTLVKRKVKTGAGRQSADDKRVLQSDLRASLLKRYGTERGDWSVSDVSKCVLGQVVQVELAAQISDVIGIPRPAYVPLSALEAQALRFAASHPEAVLGLAAEMLQGRSDHPGAAKSHASQRRDPRGSTDGTGRAEMDDAHEQIAAMVGLPPEPDDHDRLRQVGAVQPTHGAKQPPRVDGGDEKQHPGARPRRARH